MRQPQWRAIWRVISADAPNPYRPMRPPGWMALRLSERKPITPPQSSGAALELDGAPRSRRGGRGAIEQHGAAGASHRPLILTFSPRAGRRDRTGSPHPNLLPASGEKGPDLPPPDPIRSPLLRGAEER